VFGGFFKKVKRAIFPDTPKQVAPIISGPTEFKHTHHIGYTPDKGFDVRAHDFFSVLAVYDNIFVCVGSWIKFLQTSSKFFDNPESRNPICRILKHQRFVSKL
jgi:hypothetical protein